MGAATDIDGLFRLPLDEFTAARNALAAKLKKTGHVEESDGVRALAKPQVSAWTVNQLYWRHRNAFDQLIAAGERFRKAQAAQLAGKTADLRPSLEERRAALTDLTRLAATVLRDAGHHPTPDMMRRITTTLEALATYGSSQDAPAAGRLTDDIHPPGFEALAALIPRDSRGGTGGGAVARRVIPFQRVQPSPARATRKSTPQELQQQRDAERARRLAAAKAAVQAAERALRGARTAAEHAEIALKKAAARAKDTEKAKAELDARLEKAAADADRARQEARRIASEAENAAQEVEDAERALEKARRELAALT